MQNRILTILGGLAFASLATTEAAAQAPHFGSPFAPGPYIGAAAGQSKFDTDCSSFFSCDKKDTAWKLYGGARINDVFGWEAGYTDFGKIAASGGETEAWAANLSALVGVPIGDRFSVFAKGGGLYGRTDVSASPSTLFDTGHKSGWGWTYGLGASVGITPTLSVRVDWDRYKLDFAGGRRDVDALMAGLQMRF
jgi:OOP family OmpA-OmpF porin